MSSARPNGFRKIPRPLALNTIAPCSASHVDAECEMANPNYWYARHFKDYEEKTAHLSLIEHGAYSLLLDHYYKTRGKLIANAMAIARVCRCQTDDERNAVQSILDQFFTTGEDGMYHNERADQELGLAVSVSAVRSAAGKAGAAARWNAPEDMANAMPEPLANAEQTAWQTDAQPQPQLHKNNMSGKPDALSILSYLNEQTGRNYQPLPANLNLIIARLKEKGTTPDQCKAVIDAKVNAWASDPKWSLYLRPKTLFNATNYAQYAGELSNSSQAGGGQQWE
jgi:uncharacterized phage protein (TIGR02220 family)